MRQTLLLSNQESDIASSEPVSRVTFSIIPAKKLGSSWPVKEAKVPFYTANVQYYALQRIICRMFQLLDFGIKSKITFQIGELHSLVKGLKMIIIKEINIENECRGTTRM